MRTAVDTNVISAIWSREPLAREMAAILWRCQAEGGLVICAPVHAELCAHPGANAAFLDAFLAATHVDVDFVIEEHIWREAGRAFAEYAVRRRESAGGISKRLLIDFLVGGHALISADRLLTLDPSRYAQAFPGLQLLPIHAHSAQDTVRT